MLEIQGDWIGFYTFDKGYSENQKQLRIPFRLIIQRGVYEFTGRIFEAAELGGIDDEIIIKGRQNGDEIEFTKHYTLEHFFDENNKIVSIESDTPNVVHYTGKYDFIENQFKGIWEIDAMREDDEGILHSENLTGKWVVWRES